MNFVQRKVVQPLDISHLSSDERLSAMEEKLKEMHEAIGYLNGDFYLMGLSLDERIEEVKQERRRQRSEMERWYASLDNDYDDDDDDDDDDDNDDGDDIVSMGEDEHIREKLEMRPPSSCEVDGKGVEEESNQCIQTDEDENEYKYHIDHSNDRVLDFSQKDDEVYHIDIEIWIQSLPEPRTHPTHRNEVLHTEIPTKRSSTRRSRNLRSSRLCKKSLSLP